MNELNATETAKLIRKDLKKAFPNIKFFVHKQNWSVNISYITDILTEKENEQIEMICLKYQSKAMDNFYQEFINYRETGTEFCAEYVFVEYKNTPEYIEEKTKECAKKWGIKNIEDETEWLNTTGAWKHQAINRYIKTL